MIPAIVEFLQNEVVRRMKDLEKAKTDKVKKNRIQMKVARVEDQLERKKWVKTTMKTTVIMMMMRTKELR